MAFTTEPLPQAAHGLRALLDGIVASFATQDTSLTTLSFINTMLNAAIGLLITVGIIAFFAYLLTWVFSRENSDSRKRAIAGASRSAIALFLMVDIWWIIWLVNSVAGLSDVVAYLVFFFAFFLLGFWSVFKAGDAIVGLISEACNYGADYLTARAQSRVASLRRLSPLTVRFIILLGVLGILVLCMLSWVSAPERTEPESRTAPAYTFETQHEEGDSAVKSNRYENTRYGISVQFPEDWNVTMATSTEGLVSATNKDLTLITQLNAGSYGFSSSTSENPFAETMWAVQKNILTGIAEQSAGIISSSISTYDDIGGAPAALLIINAYWPVGGVTMSCYEYYYIFGTGPVFYTMEFNTCAEEAMNEETGKTIEQILKTVEISLDTKVSVSN